MKIINFAEQDSLLNRFMAEVRDINTQNDRLRFRRNLERIAEVMAYEISKQLDYKSQTITTPLDKIAVSTPSSPIVLGTILRAGLPFHQGFLNYFDDAENAFVSAYRKYSNNEDFDIHIEYIASPSLEDKTLILADPMLATGLSMELAYKALTTKGTPKDLHITAVVASKQAIEHLEVAFADTNTTIWVGAIDPILNSHSYIVPGLGDAGDLAYGAKE